MRCRLIALTLCLCALLGLMPTVSAESTDITDSTTLSGTGFDSLDFLFDKNIKKYKASSGNASITLENAAGIKSLYLLFDLEYGSYQVTDNTTGNNIPAGESGFLHEFVELETASTSVTVTFSNGSVRLSEIYAFAEGEVPDFVQRWDAPLESGADILLFSTHGDDDQLFFAGLLPLYAGQQGCRVQVVYMTDHRNLTYTRTHEMLNGLWAVGVRSYPVFGSFSDFRIDDMEETYREYESQGVSRTELLEFVVTQLRRFKPLVAVGHDINGEYGHGMHMAYTDLLIKALEISPDAAEFPALAEQYGVWDVPKTYLHLYEENKIVLDYDQPLSAFDGMTAFEVSQKLGYPCHESQQYTWFTDWINGKSGQITKAAEITTYNPCQFGLYRSTVGADTGKNDFLENVTTYAEQERLEQERLEQERLEQERLEQERLEQERLEQERLEQERLEEEQRKAEEARKAEQERLEQERRAKLRTAMICLSILIAAVIVLLQIAARNRRKKRRRRTPGKR